MYDNHSYTYRFEHFSILRIFNNFFYNIIYPIIWHEHFENTNEFLESTCSFIKIIKNLQYV